MTRKQIEKNEAISRLREWIKPGDTIHTKLCHVSKSGMFRVIQLMKINGPNDIQYLGWNAAQAMGDRYDRERDGIAVSGCGMDMGFHAEWIWGSIWSTTCLVCCSPISDAQVRTATLTITATNRSAIIARAVSILTADTPLDSVGFNLCRARSPGKHERLGWYSGPVR